MTDREQPARASALVSELDIAVTQLLQALRAASKQGSEANADAATIAARAVRQLLAAGRPAPPSGERREGDDVAASARKAIDELARHGRTERQRATVASANACEWERNAALAVKAGDDVLARDALANRADCAHASTLHARQAALLDEEVRLLESALDHLMGTT